MNIRSCRAIILALSLAMAAPSTRACTVPVARYALERWPPDLHVLHGRQNVDLRLGTLGENAHANAWVARAEPSQTNDVRITFPQADLAWYEGPWRPGMPATLTDSPLRRRIAHDLVTGTLAVCLFLDGTDTSTNDALFVRIEKQLGNLEGSLTLPKDPAYDYEPAYSNMPNPQLRSQIPLKVGFALHRLKRDSQGEQFLVRQIDALFAESDQPAAAAKVVLVFGRGRAMPMPPSQPAETAIADFGRFLCDACSCQVKEMNPGLDLFMTANWEDAVGMYPESAESILPGGGTFRFGGQLKGPEPAAPAPGFASTGAPAEAAPSPKQRPISTAPAQTAGTPRADTMLWVLVALAGLVVLVLAAVFLRGGRRG